MSEDVQEEDHWDEESQSPEADHVGVVRINGILIIHSIKIIKVVKGIVSQGVDPYEESHQVELERCVRSPLHVESQTEGNRGDSLEHQGVGSLITGD